MSASALSRAARVVPRAAGLPLVPRRWASAQYASMKVKKNNWVEQNEILRENQFYQWTINKKNVVGVLVMAVVFPAFFYSLHKDEQERRDIAYRKLDKPIERL